MAECKDIEITDNDIVVDAVLLARLLDAAPGDIPALMRSHAITSICEQGIGEDQGNLRLTFFYLNRRARLRIDADGKLLQQSVIDFGARSNAAAPRRSQLTRAAQPPWEATQSGTAGNID
jgi:hypothetical protein